MAMGSSKAMAMKPVKSNDLNKYKYVTALKAVSGCSKVTNVKENDTHYRGDCMWLQRGSGLGTGTIQINKETGEAVNLTHARAEQ